MHPQNNFGAIRLLAAALVIWGHSFGLTGQHPPSWFDASVEAFAVRIFFVISGYLICKSWNNSSSLPSYMFKRVLRIVPGLIAVVLICALVIGPIMTRLTLTEYFEHPHFHLYFWNIAFAPFFALPGVFEGDGRINTAVNGSLWTLPAEFVMYLLLPFYGSKRSSFCRFFVLPIVVIVTMIGAIYYTILHPLQTEPVIYWTSVAAVARWAPYFVLGAAVHVWSLEERLSLPIAVVMTAAIPCVIFSTAAYQISVMLFTPYIVLSLCFSNSPFLSALEGKYDISYGVYLYGFPIQQVLISALGATISPIRLAIPSLILASLCGFLSCILIERPFLSLKGSLRKSHAAFRRSSRGDVGTSSPGSHNQGDA